MLVIIYIFLEYVLFFHKTRRITFHNLFNNIDL